MIEQIRTRGHQLTDPDYDDPHDLVCHMGAVQGQDLDMCKWALAMRLRRPSLTAVRDALDTGRIIRTHVLRPTWHLVSPKDVRWMLQLSGRRIRSGFLNWGKHLQIDDKTYGSFCDAAARLMSGTDGLTVQELTASLNLSGYAWDATRVRFMLNLAEADAIVCSGREKNRKHTYALLDERVPSVDMITKDEALSRLAQMYFRSHSPATLDDFIWWSGLTATEAKSALESIAGNLITNSSEGSALYTHQSFADQAEAQDTVHLLPPYDEYLIAYKDRSHVLDPKHSSKAYNTFGIFQPVIFYRGRIVGNWKKASKKGKIEVETSFFTKSRTPAKRLMEAAIDQYKNFHNK